MVGDEGFDQIPEAGGFSLNWLNRILGKTGLCKNKKGPRSKPSHEEGSEEPNKWLRESSSECYVMSLEEGCGKSGTVLCISKQLFR